MSRVLIAALGLCLFGSLMVVACSGPDGAGPVTTVATAASDVTSDVTSSGSTPAPTATTTSRPDDGAPATSTGTSNTLASLQGLEYTTVAEVGFPIMLTSRPGDDLSFLARRGGEILVFDGDGASETVLDLSDRTTTDGERGLLAIVRHPDDDSLLYAHYTDTAGDTVVSEFTLDGVRADPGSERILLQVGQPAANHNGGMIQFGPDGALYLGLGDGGGAGDRFGNAQDTGTLLGGLVRIDVDSGESELWQHGLRNPWRFWIDGDDIWIADVGQGSYEEIDLADVTVRGVNYGWPIKEGNHCFQTDPCDPEGLTDPLLEVERGDGGTCSITGGVMYGGAAIPELDGRFLFSDFCGGYLRSVDREGQSQDHTGDVGVAGSVVSFGTDPASEVYVLTTDRVLRLDAVR